MGEIGLRNDCHGCFFLHLRQRANGELRVYSILLSIVAIYECVMDNQNKLSELNECIKHLGF